MSHAADSFAWASSTFSRKIIASVNDFTFERAKHGKWIPLGLVGVAVNDTGFRQSVVAVERLRSYGGQVFELLPHLIRYRRTLDFLGIDVNVSESVVRERIDELIKRNQPWCDAEKDFGITMLATPGDSTLGSELEPTEIIHLNPLDHPKIQQHQATGQPLVITSVRQPAAECWPRDIKVRCRLHYYWADRQSRQFDSNAIGVLIDSDGSITETSVANLAIVVGGEIVSPPGEQVLPGVTQELVQRVASANGVSWRNETIYPAELRSADEVILMGTDGGVWFANRVDGHPVHDGRPGDIYLRLSDAFNRYVWQRSNRA
jgi:branched-subunit amino acid aminotransferase/4-amino-4-deoxychorismate lyase